MKFWYNKIQIKKLKKESLMIKKLLSKIVNLAINILAFCAIISLLVLAINSIFTITTNQQAIDIMTIISKYAGIGLIILVAFKCALRLPFFIRIPYYILIVAVIILTFFQPVYQALIDTIKG